MLILPIFLFAVSANIDSFAVGASYGIKKTKIPFPSNFLIAFITFAGTLLAMILGKNANQFMPVRLSGYLGGFIIIAVGIISIVKYLKMCKRKDARDGERQEESDKIGKINLREATALGFALSINNMGLGIGAGISRLSVIPTAVSSLIISFFFVTAGNALGTGFFSKHTGKAAELISGLIIITLGVFQIIFA